MCFKLIKWYLFKMFTTIRWMPALQEMIKQLIVNYQFSESMWTHSCMEFILLRDCTSTFTALTQTCKCSVRALTIVPFFPAMFQALIVCKIRSSLARADLFLQNHTSVSIKGRPESSPSMVLLEVVVGLLLPPGSQLHCCIVNMSVMEVKYEKMSML